MTKFLASLRAQAIALLKVLQLICTYDRTAVISGLIAILTLLAARFGFRLNASDTAYLASALTALVVAFTHVKFALKNAGSHARRVARWEAVMDAHEAAHGEHEKP